VIQCLPSKCEALSSNPRIAKKKKKKKKSNLWSLCKFPQVSHHCPSSGSGSNLGSHLVFTLHFNLLWSVTAPQFVFGFYDLAAFFFFFETECLPMCPMLTWNSLYSPPASQVLPSTWITGVHHHTPLD
jgi:hypothetical protein